MDEKMEGYNRELESIKKNSKILEMQNTEQAELKSVVISSKLVNRKHSRSTDRKERKEQNKTEEM